MNGVFNIPAGVPFADCLARGILAEAARRDIALPQCLVLLPTRRAVRALREAFLRQADGRPMLLPRMMPVGDAEDADLALSCGGDGELSLPPAMAPLRRQLLLARLVMAKDSDTSAEQAALMAQALASLIDEVQTEGADFSRLAGLVPEKFARHWQKTIDFLKIVTTAWPEILENEGTLDIAERRNRLMRMQADTFRKNPPGTPVIAAGITGSIPAAADLLSAIAELPAGMLVLPGLDSGMDDESWDAVGATHPQYALRNLLARLDIKRRDVALWPEAMDIPPPRARLLREIMRPAETTDLWRSLPEGLDGELAGLSLLTAQNAREEAERIALVMRQCLETPGKTAALITPDRALARRVAAALRRWNVAVNDSGGTPLSHTAVGSWLRLVAAWGETPRDLAALFSCLKHPLMAGGLGTASCRRRTRALEKAMRRDILAGGDPFACIVETAGGTWLASVLDALAPFSALFHGEKQPLRTLLEAHVRVAEALATDDVLPGAARLWRHDDGEAAARFIAELHQAAHDFPAMAAADYAGLLEGLMAGAPVRPRFDFHPRLFIWGLMESRLQQADTLILGGLNEGAWPGSIPADPWMSRPLRQDFGLPPPDAAISQAAHDFAQGFCAREVWLSRAQRAEGAPTQPARWLLRLDAVLAGAGINPARIRDETMSGWNLMRTNPGLFAPGSRPAPRPPLAARPRKLPVTAIETWRRDPYGIYAKYILSLRKLDPLDALPGAAEKGSATHEALHRFLTLHMGKMPENALDELLELGREAFGPTLAREDVWAFWWPRFEETARWFVATQKERLENGIRPLAAETGAEWTFAAPAGPFTLTAKADRIDVAADGTLIPIDYKTGTPPQKKSMEVGYSPQMPLEGFLARKGCFPDVPAAPVSALEIWRLNGRPSDMEIKSFPPGFIDAEAERLQAMAARFDDESTPYTALPVAGREPRFNDYAHLERVLEWSADDTGGEDES